MTEDFKLEDNVHPAVYMNMKTGVTYETENDIPRDIPEEDIEIIDKKMVPVICACIVKGIKTLFSCQGDFEINENYGEQDDCCGYFYFGSPYLTINLDAKDYDKIIKIISIINTEKIDNISISYEFIATKQIHDCTFYLSNNILNYLGILEYSPEKDPYGIKEKELIKRTETEINKWLDNVLKIICNI